MTPRLFHVPARAIRDHSQRPHWERLKGVKAEDQEFLTQHPNHANARLAYGSFLNHTHDQEAAVARGKKPANSTQPIPRPGRTGQLLRYCSPVKKAFEYYAKAIELDGKEAVYYQNVAVTVYLFRTDAKEYYHLTEQQVFDKALSLPQGH